MTVVHQVVTLHVPWLRPDFTRPGEAVMDRIPVTFRVTRFGGDDAEGLAVRLGPAIPLPKGVSVPVVCLFPGRKK